MSILILLAFAYTNAVTVAAQNPPRASPLEGEWVALSMKRGEITFPSDVVRSIRFAFRDDMLTMTNFPRTGTRSCRIVLNTKPAPKHLDCIGADGRHLLMAWERNGSQLTIAVPRESTPRERPSSLTTAPGSGVLVASFELRIQK